jgi:hypothetical protein
MRKGNLKTSINWIYLLIGIAASLPIWWFIEQYPTIYTGGFITGVLIGNVQTGITYTAMFWGTMLVWIAELPLTVYVLYWAMGKGSERFIKVKR